MKQRLLYNPIQNASGFIVAEFLFAFVLVLSIGIFIFGLTFSLATIEVGQYIVWSTARNYSAGNQNETAANNNARKKFQNLTAQFPLLTGNGASDPWFELLDSNLVIGDLSVIDADFSGKITGSDKTNSYRQPWTGVSAKLYLKLFAGFKIPFLGPVAKDQTDFEFPLRAFILRHPSQAECRDFFYRDRYIEGIKKLEASGADTLAPASSANLPAPSGNGSGEDNGC